MKSFLRRFLLIIVGLLLVGALVYAFLPKPVPVDLAEVERGPLRVTVDEDGKTEIKEKYVVSAPLRGRLQRIRLQAGDPVQEGKTLLAVIAPTDPALLDARALAEAEARVQAAQAALQRAETAKEAALAEMQYAESELSRVRKLFERGGSSQQELEQAQLAYKSETQEYKSAKFAQEIAQFELKQAEAALLRTQKKVDGASISEELSSNGPSAADENSAEEETVSPNFEIYSPIDGRVLRVLQESETIVTPGMSLLELGDPNDLEVKIDVLSTDAVKIAPGDKVLLEHWGGEKPLLGTVRLVEPSAFTKISALGVEEQRVNVIVDLLDPPENRQTLGDAFRVEARIVIWERSNVLKVPTNALFRRNDDWAVFVVREGHADVQKVEIGRRNGLEAQVLDGLKVGDTVIVYPSDRISDGVAVVPR